MRFDVLTIFPALFQGPASIGMIKKALEKRLIQFNIHNLRDYAEGPHRQVDDAPFGGGAGMVFKPEPIFRAVEEAQKNFQRSSSRVILLSPQGIPFQQKKAEELGRFKQLILICGRYEGVDERVREFLIDEEISIGDYVLMGGELAAMVVIEVITRLIPQVLGDPSSAKEESFTTGKLDYPHYTRPADFRGMQVPEILLSGNHAEIEKWREAKAMENTMKKRPDLLKRAQ
jgi:tRNA (guanine37-N1)-methyltransferase